MYVKVLHNEGYTILDAVAVDMHDGGVTITKVDDNTETFVDNDNGFWVYVMNNSGDTIQKYRCGKEPVSN